MKTLKTGTGRWVGAFLGILMLIAIPGIAVAASDGVEIAEDFSSVPESGLTGVVEGREGEGWTQYDRGQFVDYPVTLAGMRQGVISFDLQRKVSGNPGHEDTIFELLDSAGERVFMLRVEWQSDFDLSRTAFLFMGPGYYVNGLGLWDHEVLIDIQPAVGQWIHVDLVWDDDAQVYGLYVDNRAQDVHPGKLSRYTGTIVEDPRRSINQNQLAGGKAPPYRARPFSWFLDRAALFQVGYLTDVGRDEDQLPGAAVMKSAAIDNLAVRGGAIARIESVSHDAFETAGYSGDLVTGETVNVILNGDAGGNASFMVGDTRTISMTESTQQAGLYTGFYTVRWGDHVEDAVITGYLERFGVSAPPMSATRQVGIDGRVHLEINASNDLVPADESSRAGLTVVAADANGEEVRDHELKLTLSTTGEYTGNLGGITFEDLVGGELDVDWGGVTDSFGEVTAQYVSGFAAKTILVSAKDMVSGDVGVGWVRSYIDGSVDILVTEPQARALSVAGSLEVSLSREWITADGQSRSRITAVVKDGSGESVAGHNIQFTLLGNNGEIRVVQGRTDARGRAFADYIAGTVMGQVQVEVRDLTSGLTAMVSIELRPDAPAEIELAADPGEVVTGAEATVTAIVTDANGNPNHDVDVLYNIMNGEGTLSSSRVATDEDGVAPVTFTAGETAGLVTLKGTVISREPTAEELSAALGAVFLYGLEEDPGRLELAEWLVEVGDEVVEGQELVVLEDRSDTDYTVVAHRDGVVSTFVAEERDRVNYGDTLGYIIEVAE